MRPPRAEDSIEAPPDLDATFDAFRALPGPTRLVCVTAPLLRALQGLRESGAHPAMALDGFAFAYARRTGRPWPEDGRA